jgi:hypothetical protein
LLELAGYCCHACKFNRSEFSVKENRTVKTVARVTLELNWLSTNSLNTLKGISGNASIAGAAETKGIAPKAKITPTTVTIARHENNTRQIESIMLLKTI